MSKTMHIEFGPDMGTAAVEVFSPELQTIRRLALAAGESINVDVPSKESFIRLHLPSGRDVTLKHSGDLNYLITRNTLGGRDQRRRSNESSTVKSIRGLRSYNEMRSIENEMRSIEGSRDPAFRTHRGARLAGLISVSQESTALDGGIQVSWTPSVPGRYFPDLGELQFEPPCRDDPYCLRMDGPRSFRMILPGSIGNAYVRSDQISEQTRIVSVHVSTTSSYADTVGAYLNRADYLAAETMAGWATEAEAMLQQKVANPYAATVAAYLLIRLQRYDLMHNWTFNLAKWFPEIPDGSIIAAAHAASQHDRKTTEEWIEKSMDRGLPVYTEGLYLLSHLLRRLGPFGNERLRQLENRTNGVLWSSPFTTLETGSSKEDGGISLNVGYAAGL